MIARSSEDFGLPHGTRRLADCLSADANSFNLVRLLAALSVLVSHSFVVVLGNEAVEPLMRATPYSLGQHAVNAFFVISGLMLAQSLQRDPNLVRFVQARVLRIFPGLLAYGFVFALVMRPFLTDLTLVEYLSDVHTFIYPIDVMVHFQDAVPVRLASLVAWGERQPEG
jgi:peptidoglycan/LPS O-acetylase OafA/YrhL